MQCYKPPFIVVVSYALTPYYTMALLLLFLACAGVAQATSNEGPEAFFILGDSHVDSGNNNYIASLSKANLPPNGIDFKASRGWPTGRYTNGRTITDIIEEELGQTNYAQPFLAPNTKDAALLDGVNYASGAGGILNQTGRVFVNRLGMDIQLDYFNITRQQLDTLLGNSEAQAFIMKKSIFSITIGANDILNNYLLPVISIGNTILEPPDAYVEHLMNNFKGQLMRLYSLDARKFVVMNIGPLGCIPYQKTISMTSQTGCVSLPNQLAMKYNHRLKDMLNALNTNYPDAKFLYANMYDILMDLITNYQQHGFKEASAACCGNGGQYQGFIPCGPTSSMCSNRSEYVFWDPYHPTEATNLILAKHFVYGTAPYISPMNVRQLKDL